MSSHYKKIWLGGICYLATILVFTTIWVPVIYHFYIPNEVMTDDILNRARHVPDDSVLDEMRTFFSSAENGDTQRLVQSAENILQGKIAYHGRPKRIKIPFDADDIDDDLPGWQLFVAGLKIPKVLLNAYEVTDRDVFLMAARDRILGWATYESSALVPKGFLWNDHAVSARIYILAKFWKHYRNHPEYDAEVARAIFQMVSRSGKLLAKPSHFTFNTNHGFMQNLALWQICLAFPTVPNVAFYKQLALDRIHDQMTFYINAEGVILEHSAGYQRTGLVFIGMAFRYLTLLNLPIPEEWKVKYQKAKNFYAQLRRPDGTLPMFGDTGSNRDVLGPRVTNVDMNGRSTIPDYQNNWIPKQSNTIYPVAGYSIWWDGLGEWQNEATLSQAVVAWSYFPGQAHKHADEMSVLIWSAGQTWLTNVGNWTRGTDGRDHAVSWSGSNAPHLIGESTNSIRNTQLKFQGWSENLALIDLERRGPRKYVARRQVIYLRPNLWVVVDYTSGDKNSRTTTTWTTSHNVEMSEGKFSGSYSLTAENSNVSFTAFFITSEGQEIRRYKGSFMPFAGWEKNNPANAIVVEQPTNNSWSVAIWALKNTEISAMQFTGRPYMQNWDSPDEWKIALPVENGIVSIYREGDILYVNEGFGTNSIEEINLIKAADITNKYAEIRTGFKNAASKYPKYNPLLSYRWQLTYYLISIFVLQEIFFLVYKKLRGKHYAGFRMLATFGWVGIIGLWLGMVYVKT